MHESTLIGRVCPTSEPSRQPVATRLSQSALWPLQRQYFESVGIEAWRTNTVPSYVTSNPYIAGTYVRLVRAFLEDCTRTTDAGGAARPVHVIELGAGSGRFAHNFLTQFFETETDNSTLRYVMTDVSRANIDFWRSHPGFKRFVAQGRLDFACFDAKADGAIHLEQSGAKISQAHADPLIIIANYVFDGIEQDAFSIEDRGLYECQALIAEDGPEKSSPADRIAALDVTYHARPARSDYYEAPSWNALLASYARQIRQGAFLFPTGALACLAQLRSLTTSPLLILSCDRGQTRLDDFEGAELPRPLVHGSFSLPVNYQALIDWTRDAGGLALEPRHSHSSIAVVALAFTTSSTDALVRTYETDVRQFGPDDFFLIKKAWEEQHEHCTLPQMLALLRLSRWDPAILTICYDRLVESLANAGPSERRNLAAGLIRMWRQYLDIGDETDLAFSIGSLLAGMDLPREAIPFLRLSIKRNGPDPSTIHNLAHCEAAILPTEQ